MVASRLPDLPIDSFAVWRLPSNQVLTTALMTRFCLSFVCLQGIADLNMFCKPAVLGALAHFILNAYVAMVGPPVALFV